MANTTQNTQVQNLSGTIIAIGTKSDDGDYPTTIRLEDGNYEKVWHGDRLQRGASVQLDLVTWANGWTDKYITA